MDLDGNAENQGENPVNQGGKAGMGVGMWGMQGIMRMWRIRVEMWGIRVGMQGTRLGMQGITVGMWGMAVEMRKIRVGMQGIRMGMRGIGAGNVKRYKMSAFIKI